MRCVDSRGAGIAVEGTNRATKEGDMSEITKDDIENLTDDLRCALETLRRNRHSSADEERAENALSVWQMPTITFLMPGR